MNIRRYTPADAARWDAFVDASDNGVFLHRRDYLGYHGDRFEDVSLLVENTKGQLVAVFPAARDPGDAACVVSHPGITYGGIVHGDRLRGAMIETLIGQLGAWYAAEGFTRLRYKAVPHHLHAVPAQADLWALWHAGAALVRRELWNAIRLDGSTAPDHGCRWSCNHARKAGLTIARDDSPDGYAAFHAILAGCLAERHGQVPVHTCKELVSLQRLFPRAIELWLARDPSGAIIAGIWLFKPGRRAWHTQYTASTAAGREARAVNLLIAQLIEAATAAGIDWLSFGTSCEEAGRVLNTGLFDFKASFGRGAVVADFYDLILAPPPGPGAPHA